MSQASRQNPMTPMRDQVDSGHNIVKYGKKGHTYKVQILPNHEAQILIHTSDITMLIKLGKKIPGENPKFPGVGVLSAKYFVNDEIAGDAGVVFTETHNNLVKDAAEALSLSDFVLGAETVTCGSTTDTGLSGDTGNKEASDWE